MSESIKGTCHCGLVSWSFSSPVESATACNCTVCRRYGALWIYGHDGKDITVSGPTKAYARGRKNIGYHFCDSCGCLAYYRQYVPNEEGYHRTAVNVRMADTPEQVYELLIDHFDGFDKFEDLPRDGRKVKDFWF